MRGEDRGCTGDHVVVWDAPGDPPPGTRAVMWRGSTGPETASTVCAFRMVERSSEDLRRRYLDWVDRLGRKRIGARTLREHLPLRPGLSAWDLSVIAERSPWRSPAIAKLLRIWATTDWLAAQGVASVELHGGDPGVSAALAGWCRARGVAYTATLVAGDGEGSRWRTVIPHPLRALAWLAMHAVRTLPLRGIAVDRLRRARPSTVVVGYLSCVDRGALATGSFRSCFWPGIEHVIEPSGPSTVWLHRVVGSRDIPDAKAAADLLRRLNSGDQVHVALDSFLSLGTIARALRDWARTALFGTRLGRRWLVPGDDGLDLHRLLQDDWNRSIRGAAGIEQFLCLAQLESAFAGGSSAANCIYLQENMSWERSLLHAWRSLAGGPVAGIQHATVRHWDTRYFHAPAAYGEPPHMGGRPDLTAVNGPGPANALRASGFPEAELREVEALRFLHLNRPRVGRRERALGTHPRLLVIADYVGSTTDSMLRLAHEARIAKGARFELRLRMHPTSRFIVDPKHHGDVQVDLRTLEESLAEADLVLVSPTTSAVLDCIACGARVAVMRDPSSLDLAPVSGLPGVPTMTSSRDLMRALDDVDSGSGDTLDVSTVLHLAPSLPRWKALMAELSARMTPSPRTTR